MIWTRILTTTSIVGALTSAVAVGVILSKNREEDGFRKTITGFETCETSLANRDPATLALSCSRTVAGLHLTARRSERCDHALDTSDAFAAEAACSAPVKQVIGERDARTRERNTAQVLLAETRRGQAAAIASAEARGRTQTQRTERVQQDLAAAPRTDSGLGRCDADCLRGLAGAPDAR